MKNNLSNNFSFLNQNIEFKNNANLEKIIEFISIAESSLKKDDVEIVPYKLNFAFEKLIKDAYWKLTGINSEIDLNDKINEIKKVINSNATVAINYFKVIRNLTHHDSELSHHGCKKIDCLNLLRNYQILCASILENIYDVKINFEYDFDLEVYNQSKIVKTITDDEINKINRVSNSIVNDIDVLKIPLFNFIFGDVLKKIIIPLYQRGYDWDTVNISTLCDDVLKRKNDKIAHYLGVIAIKSFSTENKKINVKVLDGQQRITSFLIVLFSIRRYMMYKYVNKDSDKEKINNLDVFKKMDNFIKEHNIEYSDLIKNIGTPSLNSDFKSIANKLQPSNTRTNFAKNFEFLVNEYFNEKLKSFEDCIDFIASLTTHFQVAIVEFNHNTIKLKDELEIFENLNSKGKKLSISDFIKNTIFNRIEENTLNTSEETISNYYDSYISSLFKEEFKDNWNQQLGEFYEHLTSYFTGLELKEKGDRRVVNVLNSFNQIIDNNLTYEKSIQQYDWDLTDFKEILESIKKYAKRYIAIKGKEIKDKLYSELKIETLIKSISKKGKINSMIYVEFLFADLKENISGDDWKKISIRNELIKLYINFIKLLSATSIVVSQGDSDVKRFYIFICNKLRKYIVNKNIKVTDFATIHYDFFMSVKEKQILDYSELKRKLNDYNEENWSNATTLILAEYEMSNYAFSESKTIMDIESITLEHIMPQIIDDSWIKSIIEWNENVDRTNVREIYKNYLNRFGNFLILDKSKNSKLSNKLFVVKQDAYKESFLNSWNLYNSESEEKLDVKNKTIWTFKMIENRTNYLTKYLLDEVFKDFE